MKKKNEQPKASRVVQISEKRRIGGSASNDWNEIILTQTANALWLKHSDEEQQGKQINAMVAGLAGIAPKDEIEGMITSQMLASHNAALECYRRAMLGEQSFEGRRENLNQASKLSRTYATLVEALNRHRGKGQQKVTVEHVHVHAGGQAVVGIAGPGGRDLISEEQPDAKLIAHAPSVPMFCEVETHLEAVPVTGGNRI